MENNKVLTISVNGFDTIIRDSKQTEKEFQNIQKILKNIGIKNLDDNQVARFNFELSKVVNTAKLSAKEIKSISNSLKMVVAEGKNTSQQLSSIDKNVKFPETRRAIKEVTSNLVQIGAVALAEGKNIKDSVTEIGNSASAIAANFGAYGVAISAVLTLVTPLVASFFELSDAQKAAGAQAEAYGESVDKLGEGLANTTDISYEFDIILRQSTISAQDKSNAIVDLAAKYGDYISQLVIEKALLGDITALEERLFQLRLQVTVNNANAEKKADILKRLTPELIAQAKAERDIADAIQRGDKADEASLRAKKATIDEKIRLIKLEVEAQQQANLDLLAASDRIFEAEKEVNKALPEFDPAKNEKAKQDAEAATEKKRQENDRNREKADRKRQDAEQRELDVLDKLKQLRDDNVRLLNEIATNGDLTQIAEQQERTAQAAENYNKALIAAKKSNKDLADDKQRDYNSLEVEAYTQKIKDLTDELNKVETQGEKSLKELEKAIKTVFSTGDTSVFSSELKTLLENFRAFTSASDFSNKGGREVSNLVIFPTDKAFEDSKKRLFELYDTYENITDFITAATAEGFKFPFLEAINKGVDNQTRKINNDIDANQKLIDAAKKQYESTGKAFEDTDIFANSRKILTDRFEKEGQAAANAYFDGFNKASQNAQNPFSLAIERVIIDNNKSLQEQIKRNQGEADAFNKLFGANIASQVEGQIFLDEEAIARTRANFGEEEAKQFDDRLANLRRLQEISNTEIFNRTVVFNQSMLELADNYTKGFLNEGLKRIRLNLELTDLEYREAEFSQSQFDNEQLAKLKKSIQERKSRNEKQSDEEIQLINDTREESLRLLELKYRKEDELIRKRGQDNIDLLKSRLLTEDLTPEAKAALEAAIDKEQREINLLRKKAEEKQRKEREQTGESYNGLIDTEALFSSLQEGAKKVLAFYEIYGKAAVDFTNVLIELGLQQNQATIDLLNQQISAIDERINDTQSKISQLEGDLADKQSGRRDAILRGIELEKQREIDINNKRIELLKKLEAEERKVAIKRKIQAIAQAAINGALAITNIWASVPKADWGIATGILTGISAATTAAQIALIASQKFANGGYTGNGSGQKDSTGFKVAGLVHEGEYVVPMSMVNNPQIAPVVQQLENIRTGKTQPANFEKMQATLDPNKQLLSAFIGYAETNLQLSNRNVVVDIREFTNSQNTHKIKTLKTTI